MGSEKRGEIVTAKAFGLRIFAGFVILLVAVAIGAGMYLSGSPGKERSRQFDTRRLNDLQQIAGAVDSFYGQNYRLPQDLDVLVSAGEKGSYLVGDLNDPQPNRGGYEYHPVGETDYELCAVFDLASDKAEMQGLKQPMPAREPVPPAETAALVTAPSAKGQVRTWEHPAGYFCFRLDATYAIGQVTCGLRHPCASGLTCATLPDNKGTLCLAPGTECAAAGCPGECSLAESYPVQVICAPAEAGQPKEAADEGADCRLMRNAKTGTVDCFGCANGVCKEPGSGWEDFTDALKPDRTGIPYACFPTATGCELAQ